MKKILFTISFTISLFAVSLFGFTLVNAQVELTHNVWHENTFGEMQNVVSEKNDINLLKFPRVKL
ncbi:MAG: hypothetical protein LBC20_09285, partial [Planctomycetaceae bacterium]|nr:hypothetical protein [Planctomycetaceae bacterium]